MLDPKFIRENIDLVKKWAKRKKVDVDIDAWLSLDKQKRALRTEFDEKKSVQNKASSLIAKASPEEKQKLIAQMSEIKKDIEKISEKLKKVEKDWEEILMNIPNPPYAKMPDGDSEEDNVVVKTWWEIPRFDFDIKDHVELGKALDIIDIEKAAEVSGSRFYYLKNEAVLMQFAIVQFVFATLANEEIIKNIIKERKLNLSSKVFSPMLPPVMIRDSVQKSIHRVFWDQTYKFEEDKLNLVASAEHTMAPYHMWEVLDKKDLPKRYIGYSTAFRREAGTYGKDMWGILRVHQFDKLEMESFTDAETWMQEQELIVALQEYLVQSLGIPYRLVEVCTWDTWKPDYRQFDIECFIPSQNKYRETHTSDYMTDFQTRWIKSFYKDSDWKKKLLHTNDATAFAIGRILIAIMENYQTKDWTIIVPEVLRPYMWWLKEIKKNIAK